MENVWNYFVIGFLGLIIIIQWLTIRWAIQERDWLKRKCISLFPPKQHVIAASRLDDEFRNRRRV